MFYKSYKVELLMRIELATSSLPRKCSTTELQQQWSERRDSNPRPSAWKANALSTELLSQNNSLFINYNIQFVYGKLMNSKCCGQ